MRSSSSSVSFKYALRFTLLCLLAACVLLRPLPSSVHSSSLSPTQQSLGPESNTGALSTAREGHTATLLQNGKVLVAGGRNGSTLYNTAEIYDPVTAMWAAAGTLTNARYGHSAVLLRSGQVLLIGGQGSGGALDSAEIYDPTTNSWQSALLSHMNVARFHATATMLANGRVLVAGGMNSSGYLRSAELYNPTTRAWTRLDASNNTAGNLTDMRAEHTATLLSDGRVLVTGGFNGSAALKSVELFEPSTNRWHRVADMTSPRRLHTATLLPDGTVLTAGGLNGSTALGSSETYSPATGLWTAAGNLTARRSHTATLLPNGGVLVIGGKNSSGGALNSAEVYNAQARAWSNALLPYSRAIFALNNARSDHTATLLANGQVLLAGGLDSNNAATLTVELYEYAEGSWSLTKNTAGATTQLGQARSDHTATLLSNGKVLVVGGYALSTSVTTLNSCELYDPVSGTWTPTGSLNVARAVHTATLLPNGKVLVVGGQLLNPNGSVAGLLSSAELYDPVTGQWTLAADSDVPSRRHTATLLPTGRVLVLGGVGADGRSSARAQLYDPATNTWSNAAPLAPARSFHSATLLPTGEVFVYGGMDSTNAILRTGAIFNVTNGSWTLLTFTNPTPAFRYLHRATLLPNGKVFISGGIGGTNAASLNNALGTAELYNIANRRFETAGVTIGSRAEHTATLLPNGKVLVVGGYTINNVNPNNCATPPSAPQALLYDPILSTTNELYDSFAPLQGRNGNGRDGQTATLLANGKVLIAGGVAGEMSPQCLDPLPPTLLSQTELYDPGLGFNDNWRPTITHFSAAPPGSISESANLTEPDQSAIVANGVLFQGVSEASGHGAASSASNYPLAQLRSLLNEQLSFVPVSSAGGGWTNNSFAYITPSGFPAGPALLTIYANGIPSIARVVAAPGGDLVPQNASPTGTISGRVILHNGTGLAASVTLTPTTGSPTGCSSQRTLATGPNGEFTFQDVVVSPKPIIDCSGNRNLVCTNSTANGCTVTYTPPSAAPPGTAVTCAPNTGTFFPLGTTTVTCTATNAAGSSTCRFPVTIVPFTLTCPQSQVVNLTSGTGANINYPDPTPSVTNGTTVSCKPPSGSFFPVGTTTVNCTASNPSTTAVATCSFTITVRVQGLSLSCPSDRTVQVSSDANCGTVTYPAPQPSINGAPTSCSPPSGSCFPIGTTVVTCTASANGAVASCRFNVTVQKFGIFEKQPPDKTVTATPAQPTTSALIPLVNSDNELAKTLAAPEQNQTNCRYEVRPAATIGAQTVGFFPASAIFNMIEQSVVSFTSTNRAQPNVGAPEQTGGQTCQYCTGNIFVSETPFWNIAGRIQTPSGTGVTDVNLEFSVPYEIFDDRLTCQDNMGNPIFCNTPGAMTFNGDLCAKASSNPLDPFAALHCACTTLRNDGTCEKTVLARYPGLPALRAPFDPQAGFDWRYQLFQIQPNGNFNVANVPNGANAVVTPINRPGGTQYTFTYQPTAPAGLLPQSFLQLDQVTRSYDNQIITAEAACTAPVITAQPANQTVCAGAAATFSVAVSGTGLGYQWRKAGVNINGATSSSFTIASTTAADAANYDVVITSACGNVTSNAASLTVNSVTVITTQPANQTVCAGSPVTFNVAATGTSLTYQWRKGGVNINGATGSSYTIASATAADAGIYSVLVGGACGAAQTSGVASLIVNPTTAIPIQPTNQTACAGSAATFSVIATGNGLAYQWRKGGININGATASTFTIPAVTAGDAASYDVVVTGSCGTATSQPATLTINATTSINTQPANQIACLGGSATFSVAASGAGTLSYQWRKGGVNIPGATSSSLTINPVTAGDAAQYDVVVTSNCGVTTSNPATLVINTSTAIAAQPQSQTVCLGAPANFAVTATGASLSYQWRKNGANIAGATGSAYSLAATTAADAGDYDVVITGVCGTVTSNPVALIVNNTTSITTQPNNQTVCVGNNVTFSVGAAGVGLSYQWRKGGAAIAGATGSSFTINAATAADAGNYDVVVSGACGVVTSNSASLAVNAATVIATQPTDQAVCAGGSVTFNVAANGTGLTYQWRKGGVAINGATASSYTINAATTADAAQYDVVVAGSCGVVTSNAVTLTVNALTAITTQPTNQAACLGGAVTFNATAMGTGLSYQWRKSGAPINGATSSSFTIAAVAAGDVGNYDVVVTGACGTLTSSAATLTLNAATNINTQPINQAACVGGLAVLSVEASGTGTLSYQWRKNGVAINGATSSSFRIRSVTADDAAQYDVVVTGACGTTTSNAATLTVNAFALAASNASFAAPGGTGAVDLTATVGQCTWSVFSNDNWITITSVTSASGTALFAGTGNGRVNYSVAANAATTARTGTLTIAGLNFTVTQSGSALTPRLDTLSQTSALAGSAGFALTVTGANFTNASTVRWQGSARTTTFASATQLTAQITATDLATAGTFTVDVFDPPPGGGASNALSFTVIQPNPVPTLASLNPNSATAGGTAFTLTVNGTNFVNGAVVRWNNSDRNTSFVSATQLTAAIPASDIATAGTAIVTVFNPAPGGGTSNSQTFTINQAPPPAPTLTNLNPNSATAGGAQFTLTVTGTNFVNTSVVRWNGAGRTTAFVSATQLTATIPASDIAQAGTAQVTVFTPANSSGGGGESSALSFTIQQAPPQPMFTAMSPNVAVVGGQGFTLTINGSGFSSGTVVRWNGSNRPTTVVSSTQVTATIPASDIAQPGINQVTIFTPPPGGGSATAITFVVGTQATNASAASFAQERGAAESITSVFGVELATATVIATTIPLPTTLAGTTVKVRDSLGAERNAPLFFVAPSQINYLVPQGTATGAATAIITSGNNKISVAALDVQTVAPGLFTANATGQGVPSGVLLRVSSTGQQSYESLAQFQGGSFVPLPLNLGPAGDQVFLVLFGTGMRGFTSLANASATLGGVNLPVLFIGVQPEFVGVDQVNLGPLSRTLAGRGNVNLVLTVEGRATNTVQLNIQ